MHIDAKKKSMNYILTLHVYKTFLVLEKKIHHNIILIRCLNYPEVTLRENVMSQTFWLLVLLPFGLIS